ncbi:nucleoside monophosphate kinase [Streptomyces sp. NPDC101169]|uniref:nucleoside monophosphate kinase n=1 Tax=Streptomyces sp. NPDC101169 TaxID=3366121 RepID=UPI00382B9265
MMSDKGPEVLLFGGYPGAGKTTQVGLLSQYAEIAVLSAGNLLRQEVEKGTKLGRIFFEHSSKGFRAPDHVVCGILAPHIRLMLNGGTGSFLSDGFPKSVPQLHFLEDLCSSLVMGMIYLDAPEEILVSRATVRGHCENCGPVRGPVAPCVRCGSPVSVRYDDDAETVRSRLRTYARGNQEVVAALELRGTLVRVDAIREVGAVSASVEAAYRRLTEVGTDERPGRR